MEIRLIAGASALMLFAGPLAAIVHLLDSDHAHAWCTNHQKMVHIDSGGKAVGSKSETRTSLWDLGHSHEAGHQDCPFFAAPRIPLAKIPELEPLQAEYTGSALALLGRGYTLSVLSRAPKHGPPLKT